MTEPTNSPAPSGDLDDVFLKAAQAVINEKQAAQTAPVAEPPPGEDAPLAAQLGFKWNQDQGGYDIPAMATPEARAKEAEDKARLDSPEQQAIAGAVFTGIAKAGFEASDFVQELAGHPVDPSEWSVVRTQIEAADQAARAETPMAGVSSSIAQFTTGMVGLGKLIAPLKVVQKLKGAGKLGRAAYQIGEGAAAGAIVLDPHEARLSNIIQEHPALANPITEYLAADPSDGNMEGRLKNALEGAGLDVALVGTFTLAAKALRYARAGDTKAAAEAIDALEREEARQTARQAAEASGVEPLAGEATIGPDGRLKVRVKAGSERVDTPPPQAAPETPTVQRATEAGNEPTSAVKPLSESPSAEAAASRPAIIEPITTADVDAIMRSADDDLKAIQQYGSRDEAIANGYKFAQSAKLPWQKLMESPDELRTFMDSAAASSKARMGAIKGGDILSDARVRTMVQERAAVFGEDRDVVMGQLMVAGKNAASMAADMEASFLISSKMFQDAYDVAFKLRSGALDEWGGDALKAGEELRRRLAMATELMGAAKSMSSAAGRTLRRMRSDFRLSPEDLTKWQSMPAEQLADLVYASQGSPAKLAEFSNPGFIKKVLDEGHFLLANNLLWLWPTHVTNIATSAFMVGVRPLEKAMGALFQGSKGTPIRQQALREYGAMVAALSDGWEGMVSAFKRGDSIIAPHQTEFFETNTGHAAGLPWRKLEKVSDLWENAFLSTLYRGTVGLPTRSLGAVDEFFKVIRYRAVVQAKAMTEAGQMGLSGRNLEDFVSRRLSGAFDADGRATDAVALQEARTSTFQQDLLPGTLGSSMQNFKAAHPVTNLVLPFLKTPVNVFRMAVKYTPGLSLLQKEYRQMIGGAAGAEAQAQAAGQMLMGTVFVGLAANLAANGRLTGGGPSDPAQLAELRATGWQPYSIVWEDDSGTRHYFPLGRFDPVALPLSIVADLVEMEKVNPGSAEQGGGIAAATLAVANNITDRSFLLPLNQLLQVVSDPERNLGKYTGNLAGNMVPLSSLAREVNTDPYMREARTFVDYLKRGLPGYSKDLPPRRDVFGDPVWRRVGLSTTAEADVVDAEHMRMMLDAGQGLNKPSPNRDGVDLRDVTLANGRNAYDLYQQLTAEPPGMPPLKKALAALIQSQDYQDLPDGDGGTKGTRLYALSGIVRRYREAGFKTLVALHPELAKQLLQRKVEAAGAYLQKKAERTGSGMTADEFLKSIGFASP